MALDTPQVLQRLAFIRYLHQLGADQARLPDPMCSAALLMFHDAVEAFLLMAGEHLGSPAIHEFEKYWPGLHPNKLDGGVQLPMQQSMKRLNKARVALKHHGRLPRRESIEQDVKDTTAFLAAATQLVFGIDYDTVSMASVIPQGKVRALAEQADAANGVGDQIGAMANLADAWEEMFNPWPETRITSDGSPFRFGPNISRPLKEYDIAAYLRTEEQSRKHPRRNEDIGRQIAQVTEIASALQAAARLTAIGVDFGEYQRFKTLVPSLSRYFGGRCEYRAPAGYAPATDDVAFCLRFVVTVALRLSQAEAQLVAPSWLEGQNPWLVQWEKVLDRPADGGQND